MIIRTPENEMHSLIGSTTQEKKTATIEKYAEMCQKTPLARYNLLDPKKYVSSENANTVNERK